MANFDTIKTAIDANIKTNGTQDITGGKMNSILKQMVDATDEQLTELESETHTSLAKLESEIFDAKDVIFEKTGTDPVGVLKADGTINASFANWRTSDFQHLPDNIIYFKVANGYPVVDNLCGVALYDSEKTFVAALKADGTKYAIADYPKARYIRYSWDTSVAATLTMGEKISKFNDAYTLLKEAVIEQNSSFEQGILRTSDAAVNPSFTDWYTSPFIPVSKVTKIDVFNGYPVVDNLCGVMVYDKGINKFTAYPGGIGVDLSKETDAAYIRFSCQKNGYARIYGEISQRVGDVLDYLLNEDAENNNPHVVVVDKSGNGDFETINAAIGATQDGDTIIVKPGIYEEAVKLYNKTRHIVGVCRETCIVETHTQLRVDCPFEVTSGSVENLTIIAYADKAEVAEQDATITTKAYAMHIDGRHDNPQPLYVRNCKLVSAWAAAVGIGCRYYDRLHFENCEFETQETLGEQGAFLVHNDDFYPGQGGGFIEARNCVMRGSNKYAMSLSSLNNGASMKILFAGNTLWVGEDKVSDIISCTTPIADNMLAGQDIALHIASHSNNIDLLNS